MLFYTVEDYVKALASNSINNIESFYNREELINLKPIIVRLEIPILNVIGKRKKMKLSLLILIILLNVRIIIYPLLSCFENK